MRPLVSMGQLWSLADVWYSNRLSPDSRRPGHDEIRRIFDGLGLSGDFWDIQADSFG